jgi:Flp pilus assembly protein TadG
MLLLQRLNKIITLKIFKEKSGVSAVEFALIAPILIMAYLGLTELTLGMMASRRSSHLAASVGDLTAQSETLTNANITDIFAIGASMLDPFVAGPDLKIRISSITMGADLKAKVVWSDGSNYAPHSVGQVIAEVTSGQLSVGDSLIKTDVTYKFTSPIGNLLPINTDFSDTFYHHPRNGAAVSRIP